MVRALAARIAVAIAKRPEPEPIVVILLPRDSARLYAAQLAALRAGGAFSCIEPAAPDGHLRAVLEEAEPAVISDPT